MGQQQHFSLHKKPRCSPNSVQVFLLSSSATLRVCVLVCVGVCVCSRTLPCWWGGCCCYCGCGCDCGCRAMAPCNAAVQLSTMWLPRVAAAAATSARLLRRTLSRQRTHTDTLAHTYTHIVCAHSQTRIVSEVGQQRCQRSSSSSPILALLLSSPFCSCCLSLSLSLLPTVLLLSLSLSASLYLWPCYSGINFSARPSALLCFALLCCQLGLRNPMLTRPFAPPSHHLTVSVFSFCYDFTAFPCSQRTFSSSSPSSLVGTCRN